MSQDWPVYWLDEIDSTNEEAKRRGAVQGFSDQWVVAKRQSSGRGRLGRQWLSPLGNLYATVLFRWTGELRDMTCIPFAAALAVADTVSSLAPNATPLLKWPNDVRCDGAKVSGILVESGVSNDVRWVAVGIGINVTEAPKGVDQAATSLAELRGDTVIDASMAFEALCEVFSARLAEAKTSFSNTRAAWLERAEGFGKTVRVKVNDDLLEGVFEDLGPDGALLIRLHNGTLSPIRAGDVELVREVSS